MIRQITDSGDFCALPEKGIEANKIRALYLAYGTSYDFCRFYRQGDLYFSLLDGAAVICGKSDDYQELSEFLTFSGFTEIFCGSEIGKQLSQRISAECHRVNLMKFSGSCEAGQFTENPPLFEVYEILKDGFDIGFEPWYLDMSHRVRHGVSRCFVSEGGSTLTVQHNLNGEALISQVATRKSRRGQGSAAVLIKSVCGALSDSDIYVICEDSLIGFYQKIGFVKTEDRCIITRR